MESIETPESSHIARIGYESESQVMTIVFARGESYQYFDVPAEVFEQMKSAPSKGQFLAQAIKGAYRYARA